MSATTVFKDKLASDLSFPIARDALSDRLADEVVAVYFISTSTWVRQAVPLDSAHLPVLRLQRHRPRLRVGNERIADMPEGCSLHVLVYAVPSNLRKTILDTLLADAKKWTVVAKSRPGGHAGLVAYFEHPSRLSVEPTLPVWL